MGRALTTSEARTGYIVTSWDLPQMSVQRFTGFEFEMRHIIVNVKILFDIKFGYEFQFCVSSWVIRDVWHEKWSHFHCGYRGLHMKRVHKYVCELMILWCIIDDRLSTPVNWLIIDEVGAIRSMWYVSANWSGLCPRCNVRTLLFFFNKKT